MIDDCNDDDKIISLKEKGSLKLTRVHNNNFKKGMKKKPKRPNKNQMTNNATWKIKIKI